MPKVPLSLFLRVIGHHGRWDPVAMKKNGQCLVRVSFALHWVSSRPSKGSGVYLSHFVALPTNGRGKHCVGKDRVHKSRISQHAVISRETSRKSWVEAHAHPPLSSVGHSTLGTRRGDHPPGGQSQRVNVRGLTGSDIPIKDGFCTRNLDKRGKRDVKIVVVGDNHRVCAWRAKGTNDIGVPMSYPL